MPKGPNTPQITTATSRRFKEAWDRECARLKWSVDRITYPGDVQKSLIALLLAEPDAVKRDDIVRRGRAAFAAQWENDELGTEKPRYKGLPARRIASKKSSGSNEKIG